MHYQKILLIDNFDSFTYNIVDYLEQLGCQVMVYRNTCDPETLHELEFDLLLLSPGPGRPEEAGQLMEIIERFYREKPIFGICLGLQALNLFFGGSIRLEEPRHGKTDQVIHDGKTIFSGIGQDMEVGRYHSLVAEEVPDNLEISARNNKGLAMGLRHKELPIEAVQFHPESILTMKQEAGMQLIKNVLAGKLSTGSLEYIRLLRGLQLEDQLAESDIELFVDLIQKGQLSEDQKLILLVSILPKLRSPKLLARLVEALMAHAAFKPDFGADAMDICGTGGSGLDRINTSTLSALLLAVEGLPIVKHGNKAASGRFGSFDLLEKLGLDLREGLEELRYKLEQHNLAFVYARSAHPAVGAFAKPRQRLGVPTVFNLLGPLLNPFQPERQFIGTSFAHYQDLLLDTAIALGKSHVVVVRAASGLDEIDASGPTRVLEYKNGERREYQLQPKDFGIERASLDSLLAETTEAKLKIAKGIVGGACHTEHLKLVLVNAAFIHRSFQEPVLSLPEAYKKMEAVYQSGKMKSLISDYITQSMPASV